MRFRGGYTRGHEVNAFCPALSSQCYWLDQRTPVTVRDQLSAYADTVAGSPYAATCLVVAEEVDTESPRQGFAADYDGLIHIHNVYGACGETALVTQGDISHRRWVAAAPERLPTMQTPELDFGQRIGSGAFVSGNDGCREFTAVVLLREDVVEFSELALGPTRCVANDEQPAFNPGEPVNLVLQPDHRLELTASGVIVGFELADWVR